MMMYGAVLPSYKSKKDGNNTDKPKQDVIKADDPNNRDKVEEFLDSIE